MRISRRELNIARRQQQFHITSMVSIIACVSLLIRIAIPSKPSELFNFQVSQEKEYGSWFFRLVHNRLMHTIKDGWNWDFIIRKIRRTIINFFTLRIEQPLADHFATLLIQSIVMRVNRYDMLLGKHYPIFSHKYVTVFYS